MYTHVPVVHYFIEMSSQKMTPRIFTVFLVCCLVLVISCCAFVLKKPDISVSHNTKVASEWFTIYKPDQKLLSNMGLTYEQSDLVLDEKNRIVTYSIVSNNTVQRLIVTIQPRPATVPEIPKDRVLTTEIGEAFIQDVDVAPSAIINTRSALILINFQKGTFSESDINAILRAFKPVDI